MSTFSFSFNGRNLPPSTSTFPSKLQILSQDVTLSNDEPIGVGGSAQVFKGLFQNQSVALKKYSLDGHCLPKNIRLLRNETVELARLEHPNIIKCFGLCEAKGYIVLELAEKCIVLEGISYKIHSLRQLMDLIEIVPYLLKLGALQEISKGLAYLHQKKIIHGDLKSGNVLLSGGNPDEWIFKLTDFGQAHRDVTLSMKMSRSVAAPTSVKRKGTISFEAPEVFLTSKNTSRKLLLIY